MKATLTVNRRGEVTLPARMRKALGIKASGYLDGETTPEGLLLRPTANTAVEIYSEKRLREFAKSEVDADKVLSRKKSLRR